MTYSPQWNTAYTNGQRRQVGMSAMLAHIFLTTIGDMRGQRVLELGCGVGSNAADLVGAGAHYFGMDGSQSAVDEARATNKDAQFYLNDFTKTDICPNDRPLFEGCFDIIFDRASVCHNDTASIERAIDNAWDALKPGGIYIGCDWFSTNHSEFLRGQIVDLRTRTDYPDGQFVAVGNVHFTDEREIAGLFSAFEPVSLTERVTRHMARQVVHYRSPVFDGGEYRAAVFDLVYRKPR